MQACLSSALSLARRPLCSEACEASWSRAVERAEDSREESKAFRGKTSKWKGVRYPFLPFSKVQP